MWRRWGRRSTIAHRALATLALVSLAVPIVVFLGATAQPASAAGGLRESATTTYMVDPAGGAVHVTVDLSATNTTPDQRRSGGIVQYYYPGVSVLALSEATNFSAVSDGGAALSVTSVPASAPIAQELDVQFSSNLFYDHTQAVHLRYDLPGGAPRSKSLTRVTAAFSAFEAFAVGDPGSANVVIVVPRSFTVDLVGDSTTKHATGATVTYSASAIADPYAWGVAVSARDDTKLVSRSLTVDGHAVRVRAFPNDPAWGAFVEGRVSKGLPELEKLIGLPWPAGKRLLVTETVTPYLYGYAGWYKRRDNTIEIGDDLDPQVILHEISHMWFNDLLFNERWIDEGFAQEYASRSVAQLGGKLVAPKAVNKRDGGAVRLDAWSSVNLQDQISQAREAYGYNASWYVIRRLTNEIGLSGMKRVIAAAFKQALPYLGGKNPQHAAGAGSWKRFLDYLDETGGSRAADRLFVTYVAADGDNNTFAARTRAREAYARLVAAGNGWRAPLVIREAMTDWNFSSAQSLIETANSVAKTHDEIERTVRPLGLHSPARLQADYEYGVAELGAVRQEASTDLANAKELVAVSAAVHGHHGLFAKIGLIGARDHADLASARRYFTSGNAVQTRKAALAAEHVVAGATLAGKIRVGAAFGVIVLFALLVSALRARSRRRARRPAEPAAEPDPVPDDGPPEEVAAK